MLLWLVIALGFAGCVIAWHLWQGITWEETATLFVASALVFAVNLHTIYREATTDHYLLSGYVTSLIHRPSFSYNCGKHQCTEPERWIIEQRPVPVQEVRNVTRSIHQGDGVEYCQGECRVSYPAPYSDTFCCKNGFAYTTILVSPAKLSRTHIGDSSVVWRPYYNPVMASDEVVYDDGVGDAIPYFPTGDFNRAHRIIAPQVTGEEQDALEKINAEFAPQNISVGLIISPDNLYFEKLKRAWHRGKANDFVVVVNSPDGKAIRNVNVLGWNNYTLKENVAEALMGLPSADIGRMLPLIGRTLAQGPGFAPANFSRYSFLDVKIPEKYYWKILIFQTVFFIYMLMLLNYNPNTKDKKLSREEVALMWQKNYTPPEWNWYLHPFTPTGLLLYIAVPVFAVITCI